MSSIDKTKLPYRKAVTGYVVDKNNYFLLLQNIHYQKNHWRPPGGGINEGEDPEKALLRELKEELGTDKFEIIAKSKLVNIYDFPDEMNKIYGYKWRGAERIQFLVKFTGKKSDLKINRQEIKNAKWVSFSHLPKYFNFPAQLNAAKKVLKEFGFNL
jgi:putative (di)nucleoside polyphosphate hydrolase